MGLVAGRCILIIGAIGFAMAGVNAAHDRELGFDLHKMASMESIVVPAGITPVIPPQGYDCILLDVDYQVIKTRDLLDTSDVYALAHANHRAGFQTLYP